MSQSEEQKDEVVQKILFDPAILPDEHLEIICASLGTDEPAVIDVLMKYKHPMGGSIEHLIYKCRSELKVRRMVKRWKVTNGKLRAVHPRDLPLKELEAICNDDDPDKQIRTLGRYVFPMGTNLDAYVDGCEWQLKIKRTSDRMQLIRQATPQ